MVLKGYSKNLVVVKNLDNPLIDEAYLILKHGASESGEDDIIKEANRILTGVRINGKRKVPLGGAGWFLLGLFASGVLFSAMTLLFCHL